GRPDVQPQAVLADGFHPVHALELGDHLAPERGDQLRRTGSELERLVHAGPALRSGGWHEATATRGARSVAQALEALDMILDRAAHLAISGLYGNSRNCLGIRGRRSRDFRAHQ